MRDKKNFFAALLDSFKAGRAGTIGAGIGFGFALLLMIFGIIKTLIIIILTILGYYLGVRYFSNEKSIKELLDRIFPPGRFR